MARKSAEDQEEKLTPEQVQEKLNSIQLRAAEVQLQKAELELEKTEEEIQAFKAQRDTRGRQNLQRQSQMRRDINTAATEARTCTHRQGGSVGKNNSKWGRGPSALTITILPDERELIMCSICRLRVFSPDPRDQSRKVRQNETAVEAKARVEKYERAVEDFEELRILAQDKLTPEAAAPMHCGVTIKFLDDEGRQVIVPSPCDSYLQGTDNRKGVKLA